MCTCWVDMDPQITINVAAVVATCVATCVGYLEIAFLRRLGSEIK